MPVFRNPKETYSTGRVFPTTDERRNVEYGRIHFPKEKIKRIFRGPPPAAPRQTEGRGGGQGGQGEGGRYPTSLTYNGCNTPTYHFLHDNFSRLYPIELARSLEEYQLTNPHALADEDGKRVKLGLPHEDLIAHEGGAMLLRDFDPNFNHEANHDIVFDLEKLLVKYARRKTTDRFSRN